MRIHSKKARKAISPVLATVILIAITLIAAIAIAGFVFGLFGSFTSSAQVSAQVISCSHNVVNDTCYVQLTNSGTSNAAATGCSLRLSGTSTVGTLGATTQIKASTANPVRCSVALGAQQTSGSQAVGSYSLSNGASVPFSGTWA